MKYFYKFSLLILTIIFTTVGYSVFGQTYLITDADATTCSGTFYDSGGSGGNYGSNENHEITICSDNGAEIIIDFTSFQTRDGNDNLTIYDGPDTGSPVIGTYSDNTGPGTVTSSGTCLTFVFVSNNNQERAGW